MHLPPLKAKFPHSNLTESQPPMFVGGKQLFQNGLAYEPGKLSQMEDAVSIVGEFAGNGTQFYGVFDGHGGYRASRSCALNAAHILQESLKGTSSIESGIDLAFANLHSAVIKDFHSEGTTASMAFVIGETLYTANVGDSRILLIKGENSKRLSVDHRVSNPDERKILQKKGVRVFSNRIEGVLNLSRSIGDQYLGLSLLHSPHIEKTPISSGESLVIATDGVWDELSDDEVTSIVISANTPSDAAQHIKNRALQSGSEDNITVVCVSLN